MEQGERLREFEELDDLLPGVRKADGTPGTPTGGTMKVPTKKSNVVYGYYDSIGKTHVASTIILLAHELIHAWNLNSGKEARKSLFHGDRPGHDVTVKIENEIRMDLRRLGVIQEELRGLYGDNKRGESLYKLKTDMGPDWRSLPQNIKDLDMLKALLPLL